MHTRWQSRSAPAAAAAPPMAAAASAASASRPQSQSRSAPAAAATPPMAAAASAASGPSLSLDMLHSCSELRKRLFSPARFQLESSVLAPLPSSGDWRFDVDGGLITSRPGFWLDLLLPSAFNGAGVSISASGACNLGKSKYTVCLGFAKDDSDHTLDRQRIPLSSLATLGLSRHGGAGGMTIGLAFLARTHVSPSMLACHQQLIHEAYSTVKGYSLNNPLQVSLAAKYLAVSGSEIQSFAETYRDRMAEVSAQHGEDTVEAFRHFRTFFVLQHGNRNVVLSGVTPIHSDVNAAPSSPVPSTVASAWTRSRLDSAFDLGKAQSISLSLGFQLSVPGGTIYTNLAKMEEEHEFTAGTHPFPFTGVRPQGAVFRSLFHDSAGTIQMHGAPAFLQNLRNSATHLDEFQQYQTTHHFLRDTHLTDLARMHTFDSLGGHKTTGMPLRVTEAMLANDKSKFEDLLLLQQTESVQQMQ